MGIKVSEAIMATLFFVCETCQNQGAHQLVRRTRRFSLFFIPLFSVGTRYYDLCTVCGRELETSREQAESAAQGSGPSLR